MRRKVATIWLSLAIVLGFLVIAVEITPVVKGSKIIYVDDVPGSGPGNPAENYTKIQDAINASIDGDTVFVYNGTYYENVIVNRTINLDGEDRINTTIDGGWSGDVVDITADWVNVTGFTITNAGWAAGIRLDSSSNNTIANNNVSNNYRGILSWFSNNILITGNIISNNDNGSYLQGSSNNTIINNDISFNLVPGITFSQSTNNRIISNNISGNYRGIELYSSNNNVITDNTISNNNNGSYIVDSSNNIITCNNISGNWRGIDLAWSSNDNVIAGNNVSSNEDGICLSWSSNNNIITRNNVSSSNNYGIALGFSSNNRIYHNNIMNNTNQAYDDQWDNFWDNSYPSGGNYWSDYNGIDLNSTPAQDVPPPDGIGDTPYIIDANSQDDYPLMWPIIISIPIHNIDKNTFYYKIQNAIDDADSGNTITVRNGIYFENVVVDKTLNLIGENMNTTIINGSGNGNVVHISADWVNITGFTFTNSGSTWNDAGIELNSVENCKIFNNNVQAHKWGTGIYLSNSNGNDLANNIISYNFYGIIFDSSGGNSITGNNISLNEWVGIYLQQFSGGNSITGNNISLNEWAGIYLEQFSDGNNITGNNLFSNNRTGIYLDSSSNNNIRDNSIDNSGEIGFYFSDTISYYNTLNDNNVNGDTYYHLVNEDSIILENLVLTAEKPSNLGWVSVINSTNITLQNLVISNNIDASGLYLYQTTNTNITDVTCTLNHYGIHLFSGCNDNTIHNNTANFNNYGIVIDSSSSNTITNNMVKSNNEDGIYLDYSNLNNISDNNVSSNSGEGIYLYNSNGNNITGNENYQNLDGIHLRSSDVNIIKDNVASGNNEYGIYLGSSDSNNIVANVISINGYFGIYLWSSSNNIIYHNNFTVNTDHAYDDSTNQWDNGYPSGGNYWDDYTGVDAYSGPNQNILGSDGIGDTDYPIPAGWNVDRYPLMGAIPSMPDTEKPSAIAGIDASLDEDEPYTFDGSGSTDNVGIVFYNWTFGDGDLNFGTEVAPTHAYSSEGKYVVTLRVTDEAGNWDEDTLTIHVNNVPPIADAGSDKVVDEGEQITFDGSDSIDTASDIITLIYIWDFGDGKAGIGKTVMHNFEDNGTYIVTLRVTDDNGAISVDSITVTVNNTPPQVSQIPHQFIQEGQLYTLQVIATDVEGDMLTFSDNTTMFDIDPVTGVISFTPINADVGVHIVNITIRDADGGMAEQAVTLTIENVNDPPSIETIGSLTAIVGKTFSYSMVATDIDYDDTLTFSDDSELFDINPTTGEISFKPTKDDVGVHHATITVTDNEGETDQTTITFTVIEAEAEAAFNYTWILLIIVIGLIALFIGYILGRRKEIEPPKEKEILEPEVESEEGIETSEEEPSGEEMEEEIIDSGEVGQPSKD